MKERAHGGARESETESARELSERRRTLSRCKSKFILLYLLLIFSEKSRTGGEEERFPVKKSHHDLSLFIRLFLFFSKKKTLFVRHIIKNFQHTRTHTYTRAKIRRKRERESARFLSIFCATKHQPREETPTPRNGRRRAANPSRLPRSLASNRLFGVLQRDAGWHFPRLLEQRWETDAERRDDRRLDRNV